MDPEQPDPDQTIMVPRNGMPQQQPAPPAPHAGSLDPAHTQRLPYTPDMLPDVPVYEAKQPRSGWWWLIVVGGIALLVAALAVGVVLWSSGNSDAATGAAATFTPG
ncbi:hypothetical protein LDL08_43920 [Nonomuraea glycinis]|nr:hypothetical protein [Nonomuraea glycinis]MCA2183127.1 hypothetical protein [Nonomuraea glycinis]